MSEGQQRSKEGLGDDTEVVSLTPAIRRKKIRDRVPRWKKSAQNILCSLIEETGEDATWLVNGYRYARARNGDHEYNPIWILKALLADQYTQGKISDIDLTMVVVHLVSFTRQLKGIGDRPPTESDLRAQAIQMHDSAQALQSALVRAVSDGAIDEDEAPDLIDILEDLETQTRNIRQRTMSARASGSLPAREEVAR